MASAETSPQEYRGPMSPNLVHDKADHVLKTLGHEYMSSTTKGDIRFRSLTINPILQLNGDPAKRIRLFSWEKMDDFSTDPATVLLTTFEPISDINTRYTKPIKFINKNGEVETKPFRVTELIRLFPEGPTIKAEKVLYPYSMGQEISAAKLRKVDELLDYMHTYVSFAHEFNNKNTTPSTR